MKFLNKTLILSMVAALAGIANAELKIATVDVQKVFKDYYKTHDAQKELDEQRQHVYGENTKRIENIQVINKDLQDIRKQMEDSSLSDAIRQDLQQQFNAKNNEVVALDTERREFIERRNRALAESMKKKMADIVADIKKATQEEAGKNNYDFVFDKNGLSITQTPVVMYSKDEMEITESVIKILNADAPEGFDPSKAPTPTIPAAAAEGQPAAGGTQAN